MAKNTIEWHKRVIGYQEEHYLKLKQELVELQEREYKARLDLETYRAQIKRAELMGKDGFDRDKFRSFSNPRHR